MLHYSLRVGTCACCTKAPQWVLMRPSPAHPQASASRIEAQRPESRATYSAGPHARCRQETKIAMYNGAIQQCVETSGHCYSVRHDQSRSTARQPVPKATGWLVKGSRGARE